jgi:hypothetical protein
MLPIGLLIWKHGIQFHCYIDDTQIYIKTTPDSLSSINTLTSCLDDMTSRRGCQNRSEMANRQYFVIVKEDDPLNSIFVQQQEPVNLNTYCKYHRFCSRLTLRLFLCKEDYGVWPGWDEEGRIGVSMRLHY